ncbi:TolC family outer membrane protein [Pseudoxanthomonas sp.]|uniref:TolC family outer membrane protein n=1 Tax=Pseudoxanthomonas sp. TaxID=1871049 RepID=UPI0026267AB9|nr:TolC family outer membrane protein [Pseudoxanthomonas sp.]WDS37734.1 MAG: TolC family outer membrane protein [Pseudoxanthomonas sp.]
MSRLPLVLALALALPSAASAADLMQTYEMARNGDPTLAQAEASRLSQKEGVVQARATLLPQVNGTASLGRSSAKVTHGGDWVESPRSRDYAVNLSQKLVDFSSYATVRAQNALSQSADFDLDSANDSLITRTSAAYFNVLIAIETLASAEAAEAAYQKQFDYAQKRLDVGLAPITDVHEARASYDSARATVISQRNTLKDSYEALTEITGQPVNNLRGLPDDFKPQLPTEYSAEGWVDTAIAQNPALKSLQLQVQSAEAGVAGARAGHLPTLSLSGAYTRSAAWGGDNTASNISSRGQADGRSVGVTLDIPIFSGGAIQSQVRQSIAERDSAQDAYELQRRSVVRNTRSAYQVLEAGISEIEARRSAVVSARSAYDASQVGLEVGTRTVLDVLTNQNNLVTAQQEYSLAKYNFLQNRLLLEAAAGTLDAADLQDVNALLSADANARLNGDDQKIMGAPSKL